MPAWVERFFSSRSAKRFQRSSYQGGHRSASSESASVSVVVDRLFVSPLGHHSKIVEVLEELLELADPQDDRLLGAVFVREVLDADGKELRHG